jgi:hypothetical protein
MLMTTAVAVLAAKTATAVAVGGDGDVSLSAVMRGTSTNAVARPFGEYQLSV